MRHAANARKKEMKNIIQIPPLYENYYSIVKLWFQEDTFGFAAKSASEFPL